MSDQTDEDCVIERVKAYLHEHPKATNEDIVLDYWQDYQGFEFIDNKREKLAKIETLLRSKRKVHLKAFQIGQKRRKNRNIGLVRSSP
jgi:hypothetical protein